MLRRVFLCLFLVFWGGLGFSADIALDHALALIEEGRTTLDPSALDAARVEVARLTQASPSNATYVYELARVDFYIVDSDTARHEKKPASEALELAIGEAQRAIALDGKFAEAHSLLGDLYGVKISLGGAFTGARETDAALSTANSNTSSALGLTAEKTGSALKLSSRDVWKALKKSAQNTGKVLDGKPE